MSTRRFLDTWLDLLGRTRNQQSRGHRRRLDSTRYTRHGFLLTNDVLTLLDAPGASLTTSVNINDSGEIVGNFIVNGVDHAFIATVLPAIPEPGSYLLLSFGLFVMLSGRLRHRSGRRQQSRAILRTAARRGIGACLVRLRCLRPYGRTAKLRSCGPDRVSYDPQHLLEHPEERLRPSGVQIE